MRKITILEIVERRENCILQFSSRLWIRYGFLFMSLCWYVFVAIFARKNVLFLKLDDTNNNEHLRRSNTQKIRSREKNC